MIRKSPNQNVGELFRPLFKDFIDMNHELALLADRIDCNYFEKEFAPLYSNTGCPAMQIRFMEGCMMLKHMYKFGDKALAEAWVMNRTFNTSLAQLSLSTVFRVIRVTSFTFASTSVRLASKISLIFARRSPTGRLRVNW